jgi:hypothetical protein
MIQSSTAASSSAEGRAWSWFFRKMIGGAIVGAYLVGSTVTAQQQHDHAPSPPAAGEGWQWSLDGSVVFGFNYQYRKFRDFSAWESQNWLMAGGARRVHAGTFQVTTMLSLEPWTIADIGSPQAFQTGETFRRAPLIDYQHPHDLIMALGASYRRSWSGGTWALAAAAVGAPALGPFAFMHRASAAGNPQAPLSHHYMDSTHVTPGVVTAAVTAGAWTMDSSWFKGREPDENRTDLDLGALDSYSVRLGWTRGEWSAQASGAHLTLPEITSPYNAKKVSASLSYTQQGGRAIAWMAAFGQNRESHGNLEAYLLEGVMRVTRKNTLYARAESVAKDILDAGFHPAGTFHRHRQSQVGSLTLGFVRDVAMTAAGRFGVGADVTGYLVPDNLQDAYGAPASFHVFVRYRRGNDGRAGVTHVH